MFDNNMLKTDEIEQQIMDDGYIQNQRLSRPWIPAQMMRHINSFNTHFIKRKPYIYQWTVALTELNKPGDAKFFTPHLIRQMASHYLKNSASKSPKAKLTRQKAYKIMKTTDARELTAQLPTFINLVRSENIAKCPEWCQAFKNNGAYNTMVELIKFHNCRLFKNGAALDIYESLDELNIIAKNTPNSLFGIMTNFLSYNYVEERLPYTL